MGLDAVELVLEVEATFGVTLHDLETEQAETAGQLHSLVLSKLPRPDEDAGPCGTRAAFLDLRRVASEWSNFDKRRFRPSASTRDVLAMGPSPKGAWSALGKVSHASLPRLISRQAANLGIIAFGVLALLCLVAGAVMSSGDHGASALTIWIAFFGCLASAAAIHWLVPHDVPPAGCRTLGEVARLVALRRNADTESAADEVWSRLQTIISEVAGVPANEIRPDTRFVADLHLD